VGGSSGSSGGFGGGKPGQGDPTNREDLSNTHRAGAPLLKVPAPSRLAGSEAPQGIDTVNTAVAPRSAQRRERPNELPLHPLTDDEIPQSRDVARDYGRDPQAGDRCGAGDVS
jgi:hypothetical protein